MSTTEPDPAEREALGAALAGPDDPILLSAEEWALVLRVADLLSPAPTSPATTPAEG